jgi:hypothetical protein
MFWVPANDNGCRFGHHCCRRMSPNSGSVAELTTRLIFQLFLYHTIVFSMYYITLNNILLLKYHTLRFELV